MGKPAPDCGHCGGTGKITYERPKQQKDGSVIFVESREDCHVCNGSGKCS